MKRLGISIYPEITGDINGTKEYINLAKKYGFSRIFANLLEVKNNNDGIKKIELFKEIWTYGSDLGFEVIVDVNPLIYKEFNLPKTEIDFFRKLGATGIRLDEDFEGVVESVLTNNKHNFKIELNASATKKTVDLTIEKGGNPKNLIACHNFYPMRYTGLQYERFIELSSHFKAKGVKVAAFVTLPEEQKGIGPWNVNEGMPTLEEHRDITLEEQLLSYLSLGVVDDIIISQQGATEEQFKLMKETIETFSNIDSSGIVELKIDHKDLGEVEKDIILFNREIEFDGKKISSHSNRPDYTSYFTRSTLTRLTFKDEKIEPKNSGNTLEKGDVIIVNENLGRYKGELHIIKRQIIDKENARNLVGRISGDDLNKIDAIKSGVKFKFKI